MKSLIFQVLILASHLVTSARSACETVKVQKTLKWNFRPSVNPRAPSPPIDHFNLTSPGSGYAWRESERQNQGSNYDVTRPILMENDQDWKLVNCTSYFPPGDLGRQGCTSPGLALLAPPGGGKLGTLGPKGVWAVYQLVEFRITPVGPETEDLQGEVQGWSEGGEKVDMQFAIRNSQPGYRVRLTGEWDSIVQWQVRLWSPHSYTPAVGFVIDDVVIVEDAISPEQPYTCTYPTQTPTTPPEPLQTLKFDDLPTGPAPTAPYNGYNLLPPYRISSSPDAASPPNVLSALPNSNLPNRLLSKYFLFDTVSFHLTIRSLLSPADLSVTLRSYSPCYTPYSVGGSHWDFTPASHTITVNATAWGFEKNRALDLTVREAASGAPVQFEVDDLVVRGWGEGPPNGGLGLPGCERCGKMYEFFCEYPVMSRRKRIV